jgi:uncharacterized protein YjiS (DUF1127 family)
MEAEMAHANVLTSQAGDRPLHTRIVGVARRAWQRYWANNAQRSAVFALRALDDRTLKDIGIDRSEIESVVYARAQGSGRRITVCARR